MLRRSDKGSGGTDKLSDGSYQKSIFCAIDIAKFNWNQSSCMEFNAKSYVKYKINAFLGKKEIAITKFANTPQGFLAELLTSFVITSMVKTQHL